MSEEIKQTYLLLQLGQDHQDHLEYQESLRDPDVQVRLFLLGNLVNQDLRASQEDPRDQLLPGDQEIQDHQGILFVQQYRERHFYLWWIVLTMVKLKFFKHVVCMYIECKS